MILTFFFRFCQRIPKTSKPIIEERRHVSGLRITTKLLMIFAKLLLLIHTTRWWYRLWNMPKNWNWIILGRKKGSIRNYLIEYMRKNRSVFCEFQFRSRFLFIFVLCQVHVPQIITNCKLNSMLHKEMKISKVKWKWTRFI